MSRRVIVTLVVIVVIIVVGMVMSLKHALKAGATAADPDVNAARPPATAPR